jgi:hypothetical protein
LSTCPDGAADWKQSVARQNAIRATAVNGWNLRKNGHRPNQILLVGDPGPRAAWKQPLHGCFRLTSLSRCIDANLDLPDNTSNDDTIDGKWNRKYLSLTNRWQALCFGRHTRVGLEQKRQSASGILHRHANADCTMH